MYFQKPSIIRTLSNTDIRTQSLGPKMGANSYKLTSLLPTLCGPDVDNLRYVPFPDGSYTNIDTSSVSDTNARTCQNVSFQNGHL